MRKFFIFIFLNFIFFNFTVTAQAEPKNPALSNLTAHSRAVNPPDSFLSWRAVRENITDLNGFGIWINKTYKNQQSSQILEVNLITGMSDLGADFKDSNLRKAFDADGEYLNLEIKGHKAVFEGRPAELHLQNSLSVYLNDNSSLTIEAFLTKSELIEIAEYFIN